MVYIVPEYTYNVPFIIIIVIIIIITFWIYSCKPNYLWLSIYNFLVCL